MYLLVVFEVYEFYCLLANLIRDETRRRLVKQSMHGSAFWPQYFCSMQSFESISSSIPLSPFAERKDSWLDLGHTCKFLNDLERTGVNFRVGRVPLGDDSSSPGTASPLMDKRLSNAGVHLLDPMERLEPVRTI